MQAELHLGCFVDPLSAPQTADTINTLSKSRGGECRRNYMESQVPGSNPGRLGALSAQTLAQTVEQGFRQHLSLPHS